MKKIAYLVMALTVSFLCACEQNEDVVKEPNRDGSVETSIMVEHKNDFDLLTTTHKVWVKNKLEKTIVNVDTLKSLGFTKTEGEDSEGNTKELNIDKEYEFYITVK